MPPGGLLRGLSALTLCVQRLLRSMSGTSDDPQRRVKEAGLLRPTGRRVVRTPARDDAAGFREAAEGLDRLKTAQNTLGGASSVRALLQLQRTIGNASLEELIVGSTKSRKPEVLDTARAKGGTPGPGTAALGSLSLQRDVLWDDRHALSWKDFEAKVPKGAKFTAQTFSGFEIGSFLQWKTTALKNKCKVGKGWTWEVEATVSTDLLDVKAVMVPGKSWVKHGKQTAPLLEHEQGHFDISHIIGEKLQAKMNAARPADFDQVLCGSKAAVKAAKAEYKSRRALSTKMIAQGAAISKRAQHDYDDDPKTGTDHGTKAKEQKQWEADIATDLPAYDLP